MSAQQRAVWEKVVELLEDNREYIEANERIEYLLNYDKAIADANALLMQPVQEPVAWIFKPNRELLWPDEVERENPIELDEYEALYTTTPAQTAAFVGLTDEDEKQIYDEAEGSVSCAIELTLDKLRKKNGGKA